MLKYILLLTTLFLGGQVGGLGTLTRTAASSIPAACTGTVGCYYMTEGTGATFVDHSISANNVTCGTSSNFTWQSNTGFTGTTPLFNGTWANCNAASATPTNFAANQPFSINLWFYPTALGAEQDLVANISSPSNQGFVFLEYQGCFASNWCPAFYFGDGAGDNLFVTPPVGNYIFNNSLYMLTVTYDGLGTATSASIYINGAGPFSNGGLTGTLGNTVSNLPVSINSKPGGSGPTPGVISPVCIYNSKLSTSQVFTLYGLGQGANCNP